MPNGNEEFEDVTTGVETQDEFEDITSDTPVIETEGETAQKVEIPGLSTFGGLLKYDTKTGDVGIELPDLDLGGAKFENVNEEDPEHLSATESLKNTWNNAMDQLSLTDDRFYRFSEWLFGDTESATYKEAEESIKATEAETGETIGFTDLDEVYEEEGAIGAIAGAGAAVANATSAFVTSAVQSVTTGGAALAIAMVDEAVIGYNEEKAAAQGITKEELHAKGESEVFIPAVLGTLAYRLEKAGIKGVGKAINGISNPGKQALVQFLNASGKEGGTEWAQGVIQSFTEGLGASDDNLNVATDRVGKWIKEEGLETFLQGAVGGGVSAGGGSAVRRAASQLRSRQAEDALADKSEKILEIDKQLNNPNIPNSEKKVLEATRKSLKKQFDEAVKEPDDLVRKLDDDAVKKINERGDKINQLKLQAEEFEASPLAQTEAGQIVRDHINDSIQEQIDGINKITENAADTHIRDKSGDLKAHVVEQGIDAEEFNTRLKEEGKTIELRDEAVQKYKPLVRSVANTLFRNYSEFGEAAVTKEDFITALTFGTENNPASSLVGLFESYKPEVGSFGGYAKTQLRNRGKRILDELVKGESETTGLEGEASQKTYEQASPTFGAKGEKARAIVDRLGFDKELGDKFTEKVGETLSSAKLVSPTKAGFGKAVGKAAKDALFNDVKDALGKDTKADPAFFKGLVRNYKPLLALIPKIGLTNSRGETQQWAEKPPTQDEFVAYFRGVGLPANTRSNRKNTLARWVSEGIFAEAANDLLQDPKIAKAFEVANQVAQDGKAVNAARIALINKTPISAQKIQGKEGAIHKNDKSATENFTNTLSKTWAINSGFNLTPTNSRVQAISALKNDHGFTTEEAISYLKTVKGFTFTNTYEDGSTESFLYINKEAGVDTVFHEFGHVWSGIVARSNPKVWRQGIRLLSKSDVWAKEIKRLEGYDHDQGLLESDIDAIIDKALADPTSPEFQILDEIFAGAIGDRGDFAAFAADPTSQSKWTNFIKKFWNLIANFSGLKGKDVENLSVDEYLDGVIAEIAQGKPGQVFAEAERFEQAKKNHSDAILAQAKPDAKLAQQVYDALGEMQKGKSALEVLSNASDEVVEGVRVAINQATINDSALQEGLLADDVDEGSTEKIWQKLAGGKITLLLGRPGKAWQNDPVKIAEKFKKNKAFFDKNRELYLEHLPKGFWLTLSSVKQDGTQNKASFLTQEDAEAFAAEAKDSGTKWDNVDAFGKIKNAAKNIDKLKKLGNSAAYQQEVDENQKVLFEFGDAIQALAEAGVDKQELAGLVKSFTNSGIDKTNYFRRAPRLAGYSKGVENASNIVPEHNPPAGYIAQVLFEYATKGKWDQSIKDAITEKFNYYAIDGKLDPGVHGLGPTSLKSGISKGFSLLTDNPIVRYLVSGGDVALLRDLDGNSIAEQFGIERSFINEAENNADVLEGINRAVFREEGGVIGPLADRNHYTYVEEEGVDTPPQGSIQYNEDIGLFIDSKGNGFTKENLLKHNKYGFAKGETFLSAQKVAPTDSERFNKIIEKKTGTKASKTFDSVDAAKANKGFKLGKFWLPPSAEDLKGLIYNLIPGGKEGNEALEFFNEKLFKPFAEATAQFTGEKREAFNKIKSIVKGVNLHDVIDEATGLTRDQAIRLAIWQDQGVELKGVDDAKIQAAQDFVLNDKKSQEIIDGVLANTQGKFAKFNENNWTGGSLQGDIHSYYNDVRRKELMQPWKDNKDAIFTKENLTKLRVTHGDAYVDALENTFARQWAGKNRLVHPDSSTARVMDWINNAASTLMFFNMKSATLQMLSAVNGIFEPGALTKHFPSDVRTILQSDFLKNRKETSGFDLSAAEISDEALSSPKKLVARIIQAGFAPTKAIDGLAIAIGTAAAYRKALNNGATHEEAMLVVQETAEENQQSSRPDKISAIQSGGLGRIIFAFGNTPFQYARITKRGIQDLYSGRSAARGTAAKDAAKVAWYGAAQAVLFTMLQNAVDGLIPDDDDDEDEERNKTWALNSFVTSYLKSMGGSGAIASGSWSILRELQAQMEGSHYGKDGNFLLAATSISPPIQSRLRKLNKLRKNVLEGDLKDPTTTDFYKTLGHGLNVGANVPLDRAVDKFEQLKFILEEENGFNNELAIFLGWKPYPLGLDTKKKGKDEFEDSDFEEDQFEDVEFEEDEFEDVPFNRGEDGQAHRDGTIEVDPNLSPLEREKTIVHEQQHVKDMEENGLDYDDQSVFWKGRRYPRKDGKIRYAGRMLKEGDPRLPWEARAFAAEKHV